MSFSSVALTRVRSNRKLQLYMQLIGMREDKVVNGEKVAVVSTFTNIKIQFIKY